MFRTGWFGGVGWATLALLGWALPAEGKLTPNKTAYKLGETIRFTLENTSREAITYASISYYPVVVRRETNGTETVVRDLPLVVLLAIGVIEPGKTATWEWDQREYHPWYDQEDPPLQGRTASWSHRRSRSARRPFVSSRDALLPSYGEA